MKFGVRAKNALIKNQSEQQNIIKVFYLPLFVEANEDTDILYKWLGSYIVHECIKIVNEFFEIIT